MKRIACLLSLCGTLALAVGPSAEEESSRSGGRVTVLFDGLGSPLSAATMPYGGAAMGGGVGETFSMPVIGFKGEGCGMLATFGGVGTVGQLLPSHPLVYTADVQIVGVEMDRIQLAVDWKRFVRSSGATRPSAGDHLEITIKEGERVVVDVLDRPAFLNPKCAGRNFMLEMTPSIDEEPAFAERQIAYDLWLVHEAPQAKRATSVWKATGKQGEKLHLRFPDEVLRNAGEVGAEDQSPLKLKVDGDILGRLRPDGGLDVGVELTQSIGTDHGSRSQSEGVKRFRVQPGETVRLDIPLIGAPAGRDAQGEQRTVPLQGHKLGLILTATPVR
jgi:hypothetical protein